MSHELKVGIVGLGKMGRIRKRELEALPSVRVVAVCDPIFAGESGSSDGELHTTDYEQVLGADLDVVFVCTPNNITAQVASAALERGVHVFCEKPPGRDLRDTERILNAWKAAPDRKLKFGFNHRYHDSVIQAHSLVTSGRMGGVLWMRGVYGKSGGVEFEKGWRSDREVAGGGILLDQGIHMLDLFRLFAGEFDDVRSMVSSRFWSIDMEDNAFALLRGEAGVVAALHSSSTHWKHTFLLDICLNEGHLTLDGILSGTGSYGPETLHISRRQFEDEAYALGKPRQEVVYFDTDPSWRREVEEFIECIVKDEPVRVGTPRDAWMTMELVSRIYAADESWRYAKAAAEDLTQTNGSPPEMKEAL
jgi:predicted dehydrogenase